MSEKAVRVQPRNRGSVYSANNFWLRGVSLKEIRVLFTRTLDGTTFICSLLPIKVCWGLCHTYWSCVPSKETIQTCLPEWEAMRPCCSTLAYLQEGYVRDPWPPPGNMSLGMFPLILINKVVLYTQGTNHTISTCQDSWCKQGDFWWTMVSFWGSGVVEIMVGQAGECVYIISLQYKSRALRSAGLP